MTHSSSQQGTALPVYFISITLHVLGVYVQILSAGLDNHNHSTN